MSHCSTFDGLRSRAIRGLVAAVVLILVTTLGAPPVRAQSQAALTPPHADTALDYDGNALYDVLQVDVALDVTVAGSFTILIDLYDAGSNFVTNGFWFDTLPLGPTAVPVPLYGVDISQAGFDGPYTANISVYDDALNLDDFGTHMTSTYLSTDFEPAAPSAATFNPPHSDTGVDTDGDALFNYLRVNAVVDVTTPDTFTFEAYANDLRPSTIAYASVTVPLAAGAGQTITVDLPGWAFPPNGFNGPYLISMNLYGSSGGWDSDIHTTAAYLATDFEPAATFAPPHSDTGVDRDSPPDGQYNLLRVNVSLNVNDTGWYTISADLWDSTMTNEIASASRIASLEAGLHTFPLDFSGVAIRQSGIDGPYLVDLSLGYSSATIDLDTHLTGPYLATDFQSTTPATLTGLVLDSVTSVGIPFAEVTAFDYTNHVEASAGTDGTGSYTLSAYEGDWVVIYDPNSYDAALASVTVASTPPRP